MSDLLKNAIAAQQQKNEAYIDSLAEREFVEQNSIQPTFYKDRDQTTGLANVESLGRGKGLFRITTNYPLTDGRSITPSPASFGNGAGGGGAINGSVSDKILIGSKKKIETVKSDVIPFGKINAGNFFYNWFCSISGGRFNDVDWGASYGNYNGKASITQAFDDGSSIRVDLSKGGDQVLTVTASCANSSFAVGYVAINILRGQGSISDVYEAELLVSVNGVRFSNVGSATGRISDNPSSSFGVIESENIYGDLTYLTYCIFDYATETNAGASSTCIAGKSTFQFKIRYRLQGSTTWITPQVT